MTEADYIERARAGDTGAFRRLYDLHVDRVYGLAYRMVGDDEMARDITQEAFFRVYRRLEQFRGDAAFSTWLHAVTTSVALNEIRRVKRHRDRERDLETAGPLAARPSQRSDPHLRDRVKAAVESLPEIYRTVFVLHDVEGYNHGEIARALDVAEGTSKARLSRARARLRDALSDFAPEYA
ncbi:MAG: sigma-70 family RNA polymerase sigma factor [Gemmatimonadales bacterium]|nr:MAG: sigma-70 family RNA polymerase sigma factor [Gemmatimonadales bacterium]